MYKSFKSLIKRTIKRFIRVPVWEILAESCQDLIRIMVHNVLAESCQELISKMVHDTLTESTQELVGPSSYPHQRSKVSFVSKIEGMEQQIRFLVYDNMRVNQLLREMIYLNNLKRGQTGLQTKESFDYQWRELPEGEWMPSNPDFLVKATDFLIEFTNIPREWFAGKRILDAGCGSGRWTYALKELGAQVTSFDQSKGALDAVRKLVGESDQVKLEQGDLHKLPYPDESFDMVWCFGVPHHTENPLLVLNHIVRCVAPGGYIFVMLYAFPESTDAFFEQANYEEWRQRMLHLDNRQKMEILINNFPEKQVHGYFDALSPTINDLFTYEWMKAFLRTNGFDDFHRYSNSPNHYVTARKSANQ